MKQKLSYRLGLDLGTNSIGWAMYELNEEKEPTRLVDLGVRIFSDGRNPKTKEPLAVERRTARGLRRQLARKKQRRKQTFRLLQKEGLFPSDKAATQQLKLLNPYELRIKALDEKLEPYELGRALFNLSVHRGFKSNRKDGSREDTSDKDTSKKTKLSQTDMCNELAKAITESSCRTLGEFLWTKQNEHGGIRFVPGRMSYYPLRQMYIDEFNAIRAKQEPFYPAVHWDEIFESIFYQRPLRPQERGACLYEHDKERTYKAMPCSEKFRILQDIRNLNYISLGKTCPVSEEQEDTLLNLFFTKATVSFDAMRKALKLSAGCTFNLEASRTELKGAPVSVKMRNAKLFGEVWDTLSLSEQDTVVETLITAEEDAEVLQMLSKYALSDDQKKAICGVVLPSGTTQFCKEVTEKIVETMLDPMTRPDYSTAVQMLGYTFSDQKVEKYDRLPYYGKVLVGSTMGINKKDFDKSSPEKYFGKISNPTVHVALNQTRVIVNAVIKEYGKPEQIVVELSRDLKASREAKTAMLKRQTENQKRNAITNKNITDAYQIMHPSRQDRLKFRLWEELGDESLGRCCLYCGKPISGAEVFTPNIEIEHILPFSRTLLDAESNLTVAHKACNAFKKERSPFEAFGNNPTGYNWAEIMQRAAGLKNPAKRSRFSESAMDQFEKDSGFIARQLTDNAYLSKMALKYLHSVCDDVYSVNGGMTKLLRDKWEIDSVLKRRMTEKEVAYFGLKDEDIGKYKKNRLDHRHHALDACVIGLVDRSLVKKVADANARRDKNRIEVPQMPVLRTELNERVKNIVPSFKPDHGVQGKLSKETLLGKIKQERVVEIKDINTPEMIDCIKADRVRNDFKAEFEKTADIKKMQKALKDIYPQVKIFEEVFVARTAITSLGEKNIEDIVDLKIRKRLSDFTALHRGMKFEDVLIQFSEKTGIKKVRCYNRVQKPIVIDGDVPRYLAPEDYFAAVIWEIPPEKAGKAPTYQAQYIRRDEVDENGDLKFSEKPHPAAKNCGTVHKNDVIEFSKDGIWYKGRIAGFAATTNKIDLRPLCAVTDCKEWLTATADIMTEPCWDVHRYGQNHVSVNVLFGNNSAHLVTITPLGRVHRKK